MSEDQEMAIPFAVGEISQTRRIPIKQNKKKKTKSLATIRSERLKRYSQGFSLQSHHRDDLFEVQPVVAPPPNEQYSLEEQAKMCQNTVNVPKRFIASGSYGAVYDILSSAHENKMVLKVVPLADGVAHQTERADNQTQSFDDFIAELSRKPVNENRVSKFEREFNALDAASAIGVGPPEVLGILCRDHRVGFIMMTKGTKIETGMFKDADFRMGKQALLLLRKLHAHGIWHQDFHRGNMMMFGENGLRIIDFGLSIKFDETVNIEETVCSYYDRLLFCSTLESRQLFDEAYEEMKDHAKRELVTRVLLIEREFGKHAQQFSFKDSPGLRDKFLKKMTWGIRCGFMYMQEVKDEFYYNWVPALKGHVVITGEWSGQMEHYLVRQYLRATFALLMMKEIGLKLDADTANIVFRQILACKLPDEKIEGSTTIASPKINEMTDLLLRGHFPDEIIAELVEENKKKTMAK